MIHDKVLNYNLEMHRTTEKNGKMYCRALNMLIKTDDRKCECCPLWNRECRMPLCVYYDVLETPDAGMEMTIPAEEKKRIAGLIQAEITDEFPDFVGGYQWDDTFEVYERALKFAAKAHKGATRKGTKIPYFAHVLEASMIAAEITLDPIVMAAAALHDVVEDTDYTLDDIRREFGPDIAKLVQGESENKMIHIPESESWKMRKNAFLRNVIYESREAKIVCLSDKISNMRSIKRDYEHIGDELWNRFNMKDKSQQAWYYRTIAEVLDELKEYDAYKEYCGLVDSVFGECQLLEV